MSTSRDGLFASVAAPSVSPTAADAPARIHQVSLAGGAEGLLVIDRLIGGRSFGGIRVIPDLDEVELRASARTMSLKYGFAGLALGGAKAALRLPERFDDAARAAALRAMGRALTDELRDETWIPGVDMGSSVADVRLLFEGAGLTRDLASWLDRSHEYTAWGVAEAARTALAAMGCALPGARFVLQGYGRVGVCLAELLVRAGAVMVAVSTRDGAIARDAGLPLGEIAAHRARRRDAWLVDWAATERIDPRELLTLPCELAIPCARAFAIDDRAALQVRARVVACAANAATSPQVERTLASRGILLIPDFVANCGGCVGSVLERYLESTAIRTVIERGVGARTASLVREAEVRGATLRDLAEPAAIAWLDAAARRPASWPSALTRRMAQRLPRAVRQPLILAWARSRLFPH